MDGKLFFLGEKYMILSFFCFGVIEQKIDPSVSWKVTTFLLVNNSPKKKFMPFSTRRQLFSCTHYEVEKYGINIDLQVSDFRFSFSVNDW